MSLKINSAFPPGNAGLQEESKANLDKFHQQSLIMSDEGKRWEWQWMDTDSEAGAGREGKPWRQQKICSNSACRHPDAPRQMCFDLKKHFLKWGRRQDPRSHSDRVAKTMREMETTPRGGIFILALTPAYIEPVAHGTGSKLSLQNFISLAISSWYTKTHSQIRSNWEHCKGTVLHNDKSLSQFGGQNPSGRSQRKLYPPCIPGVRSRMNKIPNVKIWPLVQQFQQKVETQLLRQMYRSPPFVIHMWLPFPPTLFRLLNNWTENIIQQIQDSRLSIKEWWKILLKNRLESDSFFVTLNAKIKRNHYFLRKIAITQSQIMIIWNRTQYWVL